MNMTKFFGLFFLTSLFSTPMSHAASSCNFNGQKVANGGSVTAYVQAQATLFETCTSQVRTCRNGVLSGSAAYSSCTNVCAAALPSGSVLFRQPSISNVNNCLAVNPQSPLPEGNFALNMSYALPTSNGQPVAVSWAVGDFTGFYPTNLTATQAGVSNSWYGADSVQLQNNELGMMIHPQSIGGTNLIIYATEAGYNWPSTSLPTPFVQPNTILSYSIDVQVPQVYSAAPSSYAYADLYFLFQDQVSGLQFWYGADVFDNGRTDRQIRDKMAIHDIDMEHGRAAALYLADVIR